MKSKLNLTVRKSVADEARSLGVNMSRVAEEAIERTNRVQRNLQWAEKYRSALDAYAEEVAREGLPLAKYRLF